MHTTASSVYLNSHTVCIYIVLNYSSVTLLYLAFKQLQKSTSVDVIAERCQQQVKALGLLNALV